MPGGYGDLHRGRELVAQFVNRRGRPTTDDRQRGSVRDREQIRFTGQGRVRTPENPARQLDDVTTVTQGI